MSKAFGFMGLIHSHAIKFFHDGGPYHIETSPLICSANQWTGFYMVGTSAMKKLKSSSNLTFSQC